MYIKYLGSSGFPYGFANIERQKLLSKGLVQAGARVTVVNRKGVHSSKKYRDLQAHGNVEGVDYIYLSGSAYRPSGFVKRNMQKITSFLAEIGYLIRSKRESHLDFILFNARNFSSLLYYYILFKILKVPVAFNYVELNSSMENRIYIWQKINDYLFENLGLKFIPIILPISDYIHQFSLQKNPSTKCLKIPSLCDFEIFDGNKEVIEEKYILFCGAASYFETVTFVIDSYQSSNSDSHSLYLILNGSDKELKRVNAYVKNLPYAPNIKVFSNLPYSTLVSYYKSAYALVIPLRPILRDKARFPHKIGEYTASGRPIISNSFGEVSIYFHDLTNAYIATNYDVHEYGTKIKQVILDNEMANNVGNSGKKTGLEYFDYRKNGERIYSFFKSYFQES